MKNYIKTFAIIFIIILAFLLITLFNIYRKKNYSYNELFYENKLNDKISSGDVSKIDYNFLLDDINQIDILLKEKISEDVDIKKKTEYYKSAEEIFGNKLNEIIRILNDRLDDEDFELMLIDIDEFYNNIDFAIEEIKNTNKSSIDVEYNTNKYLYEEKQRKCMEIIENYKGFLKESVWKS